MGFKSPNLRMGIGRCPFFLERTASAGEVFVDQRVEVVHTVFALDGEAALVVDAGGEASLHVLADDDIFLMDLVAERDRLLNALPGRASALLVEVPLEDGQRLVVAQRQDYV